MRQACPNWDSSKAAQRTGTTDARRSTPNGSAPRTRRAGRDRRGDACVAPAVTARACASASSVRLGPESPPPSREGRRFSRPKELQMPNALAPAFADRSTALELESLDVYRVSLEFQAFVSTIRSSAHGELRSQLDRAALSITLNVAEGAG